MSSTITFPVQFESHESDLERVISAHSSHTAASSGASDSVAAHSAGSASTELRTPAYQHDNLVEHEEELTDHEIDVMYAESDAARIRLGKLGTRSMQSMQKSKGRERSMTDTRPSPTQITIPPPLPTSYSHAAPLSSKSTSGKSAKSSGSFSAFLRRLTGKAPKNKGKDTPSSPAQTTRPIPPPTVRQNSVPIRPAAPRPPATRQVTAPTPVLSAPQRASAQQESVYDRLSMPSIDTRDSMRTITEVDPLNIPLPPSPDLTNESNFVDFTSPPAAYGSAGRRAKQNGMQSFEGFEIEEQDEETEEEADQVRPIPSLRINTNNAQASDSAPLKSGSSIETTLQTPTSAMSNDYRGASGGERSPERYIRDVSSNSPPKKAPAGPAPVLDRKGSKWRKSVMGIADSVPIVTRKQTTRLPPSSSHNSYITQQQRIANNRISCQPTIHNNTTITRGLTTIKSKEEQEVAETFFLN